MEENLKQLPVAAGNPDIVKVAIFGPESTGKTTLASSLAAHFNTVWVREFARDYLQEKFDDAGIVCQPDDILPIAYGQTHLENEQLRLADTFLFCDTCLLQTKTYSEIYYGFCDPLLAKAARKHKYDLFFLTDIDVPWEEDDLRDRPNDREKIFETFKNALLENGKPFITLSGNAQSRLEQAISIVEKLEKAKKLGFSSHDFIQIFESGASLPNIEKQLELFKNGIAKTTLDRPATADDGILKLTEAEFNQYANSFQQRAPQLTLEKFIPASGAASRMFKFLAEFINEFDPENETMNAYINRRSAIHLAIFLAGKEKFPFFQQVDDKVTELFPESDKWERPRRSYEFIKLMLDRQQFDFCNKPKGVLPFHKYRDHVASAIEEHLNETVYYCSGKNNVTNLHFTVTEAHQKLFERIISDIRDKVETQSGSRINTSFSYQDRTTDTIAVDFENRPFRDHEGRLVFRPGGHGALIENLNRIDADIVFIKNIDNVIQDRVGEIAFYKKALAGLLTELQMEIFRCLREVSNDEISENGVEAIANFIRYRLNIPIIGDFSKFTLQSKIEYITEVLNRPIRVCGMVKNEGEPGGGPFWVRDAKGNLSLQIVESSQIDLQNPAQAAILSRATHFNPVDLVCGIKNFKGEKFDLTKYVNHNSGFIVEKTKAGRPLKGYELPGLWNGAMADWITVFVEVPLITFSPVKTVNDLLKSSHQPH